MASDPGNMMLVGQYHSKIEYNETSSLWTLTDAEYNLTATCQATKITYALGKCNWTILNDNDGCRDEKVQTTVLKLSGCNPENEFTCDDGQCINMEERCDRRIVDCNDGSDEIGCQLFSLVEDYEREVSPPVARVSFLNRAIEPVPISTSMRLLRLMGIDEDENTIDLQFEIILEWRDQRITFYNLKNASFLNAFTENETNSIWLPVVIYSNTDQKETTRLGWVNEWSTTVVASRDVKSSR